MTLRIVWDVIDPVQPQGPIAPDVLTDKAAIGAQRNAQMVCQAESLPRSKRLAVSSLLIEPATEHEQPDPQVIILNWNNPIVLYQRWRIKLPRQFADRQLYRTVTDDQLAYWCVVEGDLVLSIPLPLVAITGSKKFVNSYNIQGVWVQDPPPT